MTAGTLLAVQDLSVEFTTGAGIVRAVEGVGFELRPGETVGVVGESGSGKSVTALAMMGLLAPAGRVTAGRVLFESRDLLPMDERMRRDYRGRRLSMIFQNARAALNPIRPVGRQIADVLRRHARLSRTEARARAIELLARVQIADPARCAAAYPFELSGGMCQRVMVALAVACGPRLLIADEPTTGLDVTTAAGILDLLAELAARERMATLLISHDLAMIGERCDRVVVMHAGHIVEAAPVKDLLARPRHPYTVRLIAATPRPDADLDRLEPIPGGVPDLRAALPPCRYRARCERAKDICDEPPLPRVAAAPGHMVACRFPG